VKDGVVGLDLLTPRDAPFVTRLTGDLGLAAALLAARDDGSGYGFVIRERGELRGLGAVRGIAGSGAELGVLIDPGCRRQGYGAFALGLILEFAFRNLRLDRLSASGPPGEAWRRTLAREGFAADGTLTAAWWAGYRNAPRVATLHRALRPILEAELAAGNAIAETGDGWPDRDSVFIRLRDPFRTAKGPLPVGVEYVEANDAHWWKAEYHTTSPRHLLVC